MTAPNNRAASALLLDLATALALVTALVYATGWTYAYHYFGHFELGLLMLEIPTRYYFMYGFWVFKEWWWVWVLFYVLVVLFYVLVVLPFLFYDLHILPRLRWIKAERSLLLKHLQVLLVLVAFWLAWWLASTSADRYYREQQGKGFVAYPHVRVWPKTSLPEDPDLRKLYAALPEGGYRLLLQNRDRLFLFKLPRDGKPARLAVTELALSEVRALRVLP